MSFVVDITFGTAICWYLLHILDKFLEYKKAKVDSSNKKLKSGNYFKRVENGEGQLEVQIDYLIWFEQTTLWCLIVIIVGPHHADESGGFTHPADSESGHLFSWQLLHVFVNPVYQVRILRQFEGVHRDRFGPYRSQLDSVHHPGHVPQKERL